MDLVYTHRRNGPATLPQSRFGGGQVWAILWGVAIHRVFSDQRLTFDQNSLSITGEQAHHAARVKRVVTGDVVDVLDGQGSIARCRVTETGKIRGEMVISLSVERLETAPAPSPWVHIASATPKADRASWMIEQLAQVGCAAWSPLQTQRGVVDPGETKVERLQRISTESAKQCGRPWLMQIAEPLTLKQALGSAGMTVLLADETGKPAMEVAKVGQVQSAAGGSAKRPARFLVLVGPEGGWTPQELELADAAAGGPVARIALGPHVQRIETAAVIATALLMQFAGQ